MHHEDHDMSSASQYHTRKCMLISVHVTFTLGVCNQLSQEFPMGKEQDSFFKIWSLKSDRVLLEAQAPRKETLWLWQLIPPVSTFPAVDESL